MICETAVGRFSIFLLNCLLNQFLQRGKASFQACDAVVFCLQVRFLSGDLTFQFLVQSLNRRQRHPVGIDRPDGFVVGAQAEGVLEILGDRAEMFHGRILVRVTPLAHRQRRHFFQDRPGIDFLEIGFAVPVRGVAPDAAVGEARAVQVVIVLPALIGPM